MRYTSLFGKTVRSVPANLKMESHKLLYKGGFIRQVAAGRYAFLPLGFRVWEKIMKVIEEEMVTLGSQRMLTPNLHPIEIWQATNRDTAFGEEMYILEDHHGSTFALGATAEGMMVELVKQFSPTYKQLPFSIHQFSNKFRDEKRPRGGLLRVREFVMKDAYSFDRSEKELLETYHRFYDAYLKIAKRFDLEAVPVLADSGAIGGEYNHEFIVKSESGEGEALTCEFCDYAAHLDRAEGGYERYPQDNEMKEVKEHKDETALSCEVLAKNMGIPLQVTTKTILFKSGKQFIAAMVRGDYSVNEAKLKRHLKLDTLKLASEMEVKQLTGSAVGFAGPIGLPESVTIIADVTCEDRVNFEAGGNKTGIHLYNLNFERDMPTPEFADIRAVSEGDGCIKCNKGKLVLFTGIEWGHCFKLDTFYSKPHEGSYTAKDGSQQLLWMGSYGIGLGRTMATVVETHSDERGIAWPKEIAPYAVHLVSLKNAEKQADLLYKLLINADVDVLWDDREETPGTKFADADLIGVPVRLVVSQKTGVRVEWKDRESEKVELLSIEEVVSRFS